MLENEQGFFLLYYIRCQHPDGIFLKKPSPASHAAPCPKRMVFRTDFQGFLSCFSRLRSVVITDFGLFLNSESFEQTRVRRISGFLCQKQHFISDRNNSSSPCPRGAFNRRSADTAAVRIREGRTKNGAAAQPFGRYAERVSLDSSDFAKIKDFPGAKSAGNEFSLSAGKRTFAKILPVPAKPVLRIGYGGAAAPPYHPFKF